MSKFKIPPKIAKIGNTIFDKLFNTRASGLYFIIFAFVIGLATFLENDYGTSAAQKVIFKAWWFELLLILFSISIIYNIVKFRMIQQRKWALVMFHAAIVIIILGAGVTRYYGFEGVMHIREGDTSNSFLSADSYLKFKVLKNQETFEFEEKALFASLGNNKWSESYLIDDALIKIRVKEFIPNPVQKLVTSLEGKPTLKIVIGGVNGREEYFISKGETKRIRNVIYNFKDNEYPGAFNIAIVNGELSFKSSIQYERMMMASQSKDTVDASQEYKPLLLRTLHTNGNSRFVFGDYNEKGKIEIESENIKVKNESTIALLMEAEVDGIKQEQYVFGNKGFSGRPKIVNFNNLSLSMAYGSKDVEVPFEIRLNRFILEKYPGTNSASSYASQVIVYDFRDNTEMDYKIYMNHILNYGGYRFFQSSFDKDEKGTYLSVNSDYWGTLISYIGYGLLTLGMILTFFSKKTRFYMITKKIKKMRTKSTTFVWLFVLMSSVSFAQNQHNHNIKKHVISKDHATQFSELVVQDFKGRMKPMHTLTRELMRKIHRKESYQDYNADQVVLSMFADKRAWYSEKVIKLGKHEDILSTLGVSTNYASYKDFFDLKGAYKLRNEVRKVYSLDPKDRGVYEKELIKIDERLNVLSMIFSGNVFKIIPVANDANNTWISKHSHSHGPDSSNEEKLSDRFFEAYTKALNKATSTKSYAEANNLLNELKAYQEKNGGNVIPSNTKLNAEIFLNNFNIFNRLTGYYLLLGLGFLFTLFLSVFKPNLKLKRLYQVLFGLVVLCFTMHTLGLGIRWYISGHAPWSNGYESMIYIAWATMFFGLSFGKKSPLVRAAAAFVVSIILMFAHMNWMDPAIANLVPVLDSYWVLIHVSIIVASYGPFVLSMMLGFIALLLVALTNEKNKKKIELNIKEITIISEMTMTVGLVMLTIGNFLGGMWANESWGRYWGWDPKETWALINIILYAFILHTRLIPGLRGKLTFNMLAYFAFAGILMGYLGVNHLLSGLHSYAAGDSAPIPNDIWIWLGIGIIISALAYVKNKKYYKK